MIKGGACPLDTQLLQVIHLFTQIILGLLDSLLAKDKCLQESNRMRR